jgi:hypothetical protein
MSGTPLLDGRLLARGHVPIEGAVGGPPRPRHRREHSRLRRRPNPPPRSLNSGANARNRSPINRSSITPQSSTPREHSPSHYLSTTPKRRRRRLSGGGSLGWLLLRPWQSVPGRAARCPGCLHSRGWCGTRQRARRRTGTLDGRKRRVRLNGGSGKGARLLNGGRVAGHRSVAFLQAVENFVQEAEGAITPSRRCCVQRSTELCTGRVVRTTIGALRTVLERIRAHNVVAVASDDGMCLRRGSVVVLRLDVRLVGGGLALAHAGR